MVLKDKVNLLINLEIKKALCQCTDTQIDRFHRMYPSIDKIPWDKLRRAMEQIQRTIDDNKRKDDDKIKSSAIG